MKWYRHREIRVALFLTVFIPVLGMVACLLGYRVNFLTPSAPPGIWRSERITGSLKRGDYVRVDTNSMTRAEKYSAVKDAHGRGYFGHTLFSREPYDLLKRIGGVPGDVVDYSETAERVTINGAVQREGVLISADSSGRVMPKIIFPYRVPDGEYWLSSAVENGFDSRYFGSVPAAYIKSRMSLLLTW